MKSSRGYRACAIKASLAIKRISDKNAFFSIRANTGKVLLTMNQADMSNVENAAERGEEMDEEAIEAEMEQTKNQILS